ncbi:arylsulfatase A [Hyalella azteca]|uniref:Arylsulfatase A n=1 Tax=Hyalella azteca TaxID=294128 RepID=A0A8B7N544_HYAAZ|nr:arylsulfatase A [Hyalella azteca]
MATTGVVIFICVCTAVLSAQLRKYLGADNTANGVSSINGKEEIFYSERLNKLEESKEYNQQLKYNAKPPNVVLFLVDDLGYGDLSSFGHPTSRSPAIDRLAAQSKVFTQFYVTSPVCSPSRASLLTGRYQVRSGIYPGVLEPDNPLAHNTTIVEQPTPLSSLASKLLARATQFLEVSALEHAPFFLYMPFMHVHTPHFSSAEFVGKSARGTFGDALLELDHSIDTILQTLDALDLADNTVVWFLSDNGPDLMHRQQGGCAGALRCGKGTSWEGGVRVPAFVRWPGHIVPGRTDELLSSLEVLPTIAALTGADTSGLKLDGFDASDFLLDKISKSPREYFAVYPKDPSPETGPYAVVYQRLKAHFFTAGNGLSDDQNYDEMCTSRHPLTEHNPPLLYDLSVDPGERWNIANDTSQRSSLMKLTAWRTQHMADMTWMTSATQDHEERSQPCCTDRRCNPFPSCCDCPDK